MLKEELWSGGGGGWWRAKLEPGWSAVQEMYENSETALICAAVVTEELKVEVGRQQGAAPRPFLFVTVMDSLADVLRQESPQTTMSTYDTVICCERRWRKIQRGLGKDRSQGELTRRIEKDRRHVGLRGT